MADFYNRTLGYEVINCIDHEQRVSLRPTVYQAGKLWRKLIAGKSDRQVLMDFSFGEIIKRQLLALLLSKQLLFDRLQRMSAYDQLRSSIGPNQHKPRRMTLPGQI